MRQEILTKEFVELIKYVQHPQAPLKVSVKLHQIVKADEVWIHATFPSVKIFIQYRHIQHSTDTCHYNYL